MVLITLEGIDGSGKSSLIEELKKRFPKAIFTREPQDKAFIKEHSDSWMGEMFAYMLDHAHHCEWIKTHHKRDMIFCDRYTDSRIAYQSVRLHLDPKLIESFHFESIEPDYTFVLIIDVDKAFKRLEERDGKYFFTDKIDMTDNEYNNDRAIYREELQKVQNRYIQMCVDDKHHHSAIDVNNRTVKDIADIVEGCLMPRFGVNLMNAT